MFKSKVLVERDFMSIAEVVLKPSSKEFKDQIQFAISFATLSHSDDVRKGNNLPYICHPLDVLSQVANWECHDLIAWKAAICHDVLEDCEDVDDVSLEKIIGEQATKVVKELTFVPENSNRHKSAQKLDYMRTWMEKDESGTWIKSVTSLVVKIADRICNTKDFLLTNPEYAPEYWSKANAIFRAMDLRKEEIIEVYGEKVWARMRHSRTNLTEQLIES